ncbi:hypothetical protein [Azonexus sp. IMCC34839]|uniref:hypothetical protein n=1 Tax=Azonexus sp. IMCC34839 TaxID=3133695 RepID=UPI00399C11E6
MADDGALCTILGQRTRVGASEGFSIFCQIALCTAPIQFIRGIACTMRVLAGQSTQPGKNTSLLIFKENQSFSRYRHEFRSTGSKNPKSFVGPIRRNRVDG